MSWTNKGARISGRKKDRKMRGFFGGISIPQIFSHFRMWDNIFFFTYLARTTQDKIMKNKKFKNLAKTREMQK
jgi:hypothetical protein